MRFLCHISGHKSLNLPYFLHTDLLKISSKIQTKPNSPSHLVYHSGLIKILVKTSLDRKHKSWDRFIVEEGFTSLTQKKKLGRPTKTVKNMKSPVSPNPQTTAKQKSKPNIPSSKAQSIPKKRTPFTKYKSTSKGPIPSSSGLKEVNQVYKRRKPFSPQKVSIPQDIETPAVREESLPIR